MADKQISQLVAATTINNDDLFVMQQGGTAKKLSGQKLSDFVYQSAADQIERVDEAVEQAQAAVDSLEEQKNEIAQAIASMAELGTDTTLTTPGMAADAAATGEVKDIALARFEQAEITGVPIATFEDGADNVPVKKLIVGINPVQDLHGQANPYPAGASRNLWDEQWKVVSGHIENKNTIPCTAGTAYYINKTPSNGWKFYDANNTLLTTHYNSWKTAPENATYMTFALSGDTYGTTYKNDVIVAESPANVSVPYEPYANICPITGWTGANVTATGTNLCGGEKLATNIKTAIASATIDPTAKTVTFAASATSGSVFIEGCFKPNTAYTLVLYGRNTTTAAAKPTNFVVRYTDGTSYYDAGLDFPSSGTDDYCVYTTNGSKTVKSIGGVFKNASTILYYEKCGIFEGVVTAADFEPYQGTTYSITFPTEAGTVYGGTLDVTNGVLTVDRWYSTFGNASIGSPQLDSEKALSNRYDCPIYGTTVKNAPNNGFLRTNLFETSWQPMGHNDTVTPYKCAVYGNKLYFTMPKGMNNTEVRQFLLDNNAEFVCQLATPITYTLTPSVVRTLLALNNIWADTGNINDLIYRKMPIPAEELDNTLESMIAGVEETMEATQNYAVDKLVVAVHKLYHIDSNIASGETLVPGTNCHITTIADELTNIMATVDGYFNALGNLATLNYQVVT